RLLPARDDGRRDPADRPGGARAAVAPFRRPGAAAVDARDGAAAGPGRHRRVRLPVRAARRPAGGTRRRDGVLPGGPRHGHRLGTRPPARRRRRRGARRTGGRAPGEGPGGRGEVAPRYQARMRRRWSTIATSSALRAFGTSTGFPAGADRALTFWPWQAG